MIDSSFITSPLTSDFADVWSEPEMLSAKGHNAIYVATHFGRKYILKALAESYRESTPHIELLRKEFSIGVGLDHPNIARVLDFGHMDSIGWYIQMEFIDGITLDHFLETNPSNAARRQIVMQLLDALSFLHERQIVHRDVKPSNILITRNGSTVKLIDFGVSDTDDYVTFKQPAGSLAYIAPEQLAGKQIDNRADIFSFGRILQLVFPHRYRCIARRCARVEPARRYSSCTRVSRAIRNADRLRLWLPMSLLVLLVLGMAVLSVYASYQKSEHTHIDKESQLFMQIDSLSVMNDKNRATVDSLNCVVDSLVLLANTPSPRDVVRQKAAAIHFARHDAIRKAVKSGEIKTQRQMKDFDGGIRENFRKTEQSIKDPVLHEDFMQAYYSYFNLDYALYDSLSLVLPEE